jgi:hypothetical protein
VNCIVIQRRLLAAEQPEQPPPEVRSHLGQCSACRAWQRRLVQIERQIPRLPVPPSTARDELLAHFRGAPSTNPLPPATELRPIRWTGSSVGSKEWALRKVSLAFAMAAALLVFALSWWAWPHQATGPATALAVTPRERYEKQWNDRLEKTLLGLAGQERLRKLADLAEEVHGEACKQTGDQDKLGVLAHFYARVVAERLLVYARDLPPQDRSDVLLDIAQRLARTESQATRLATQLEPHQRAAFTEIARVARRGERTLRDLCGAV